MSALPSVGWDWCRTTESPDCRWPRLYVPDCAARVDIDQLGDADYGTWVELDVPSPAATGVALDVIDQLARAGRGVFALRMGAGVTLPDIYALVARCPDLAAISADNEDVPTRIPAPHPIWWRSFYRCHGRVPGPSGPGTSPTLMWADMDRCDRYRHTVRYPRIDPVIQVPIPPALAAVIDGWCGHARSSVYTHMRVLSAIRAKCAEEAEYVRSAGAGDAGLADAARVAKAAYDYLHDCCAVTREVLPGWAGSAWYDQRLLAARRACLWLWVARAEATGKCMGSATEWAMPHVEAALRMAMATDGDDDNFIVPGPAAPDGTCLLQCDARPGCDVGSSVRIPAAGLCRHSIVAQALVADTPCPPDGVWRIRVPFPVRGVAMMALSITLSRRLPLMYTHTAVHDYSFGALCEALIVAHFLNMPQTENHIIRAMVDLFFTRRRNEWACGDVP